MSNKTKTCHTCGAPVTDPHIPALEWQPIETAPKDGTFILITGGRVDVYEWYNGKEPESVMATWTLDGWHFASWDGAFRSEYLRPTHWMPQPCPPPQK